MCVRSLPVFRDAMKVRQTIRRLVEGCVRLGVAAVVCLGVVLLGGSAAAQGHLPGQTRTVGAIGQPLGGIPGHGFMSPMARPHTGVQLGLGGRWWDESRIVRKLNLRTEQQRKMDDIFETNKATLVTLYSNLQREQTRLISMPPGDLQDESRVFAAIDRVAAARTDLEKENAHILVQIRQQLNPAQLEQLDREIASGH
jgi:Spy/CpxP family protein refolding chaperone